MKACLLAVLCIVATITAFAADLKLTVADTIGKAWDNEPIYWDITFKPGEWKGGDMLVQRDGKPILAQALVTAKNDDGSVKTARVSFLIDHLDKDAKTEITAELGKTGPTDTDLSIQQGLGFLTLANKYTAVKLLNLNAADSKTGEYSPILGVRTLSGKWTGGGRYDMQTAKPTASKTEILEKGPVRLAARVTTTFDNGRTHVVTVSLLAGARTIDVEESFNIGPDDKYKFKEYKDDRDELAWEWWSWYGDSTNPKVDTHPNNWVFMLNSPEFSPKVARYNAEGSGDRSTDASKTDKGNGYDLTYATDRMEKILEPVIWWRPDAASSYGVSPSRDPNADVVALCTNRTGDWRNPNILPLTNITLRTRANALRIYSSTKGALTVQCPIGLGARSWTIRVSDVAETYAKHDLAPNGMMATSIQRDFGLDTTRKWITDWEMTFEYPRLFIDPKEKEQYYANLKGKENGAQNGLRFHLMNQDQAGATMLYNEALKQADDMINGYYTHGVNGYPGWMLGYWHGIVVACDMDNLLGSPYCTREMAQTLKKKMAILTYLLVNQNNWPDKQSNFGWGSMNMPVGRWGGLVVMASSISEHPMANEWLKDANRYFNMLLKTEYNWDGTGISCPHYIGASSTSFYAWIAMTNSGKGSDVSKSPVLQNFARYYMQLMTPIDKRWGIRVLNNEGDTRPGSSPLPGILATLFKKSNPELAAQLMQIWIDGGRPVSQGMGVPDGLIIDSTIKPAKPKFGPEVFPGFGAILRYREPGTPEEAYLSFLAGNFMIDHTNADQMAFEWYEKGVPVSLYQGDLYVPGAFTSLSHNTLSWDVRAEGKPTPGKDKPGDWYFDHHVPWVVHTRTPRLHLQIGWDKSKQEITDTRGMVTLANDQPGTSLLEGKVKVLALDEVPTRADFSVAMMQQIPSPQIPLQNPFTWTRRLLYVKAPTAAGMNYVVVRDDLGGYAEHTPSFSYWSLSNDVRLADREAHFTGQLAVDTDLYVTVPAQVKLSKDSFTHDQCEPEVKGRGFTTEKQVLARIDGQPGKGFLVTIFPRKADEPQPIVQPWMGDLGTKVTWQGETHYILLDTAVHDINTDGIKANASSLVVKVKDAKNYCISLPAGGTASYRGQKLSSTGPIELTVIDGKVTKTNGKNLIPAPPK
ncbi:MAG: hypothetical protein ACYDBB_23775 [Armatimonadota bacterium]